MTLKPFISGFALSSNSRMNRITIACLNDYPLEVDYIISFENFAVTFLKKRDGQTNDPDAV